MRTSMQINGISQKIEAIKIDFNRYRIVIFENEVSEFIFTLSLKPSGASTIPPTYQLDANQSINSNIKKIIPEISNWLISKSK